MKPREGEFESLRLAAKAADRGKAAEREWPVFEKRLRELGYGPLAIAHAFSTMSGPGSVAEALEVLRVPVPESHPTALTFEVTEARGSPSAANRVTITSVERDSSVLYVNYDIVPPPDIGSHRVRGEAKDDLGNDSHDLGGHFGITGRGRGNARGHGGLRMPLPPREATMLRIRIRWEASVIRMPWDASPPSIWSRPAHEVRVSLPD